MDLLIERLGLEGDGIAHAGGQEIFVPHALPGEIATGEPDGNRIGQARITRASADRVAPCCPHFGACGGCTLQHASDGFLAEWKAGTIVRALAAHGLAAPMRPILTSPPRSRRRAVFAGERTRKTELVGFHARGSDRIVPVSECSLIAPELLAARPALQALTRVGASRSSAIRIAVTTSDSGLDFSVTEAKPLEGPLWTSLTAIAESHDMARLAWNGEVVALRRPPGRQFGKARVMPPPGAFGQATAQGEAALVGAVREVVQDAARIADLFAGCGTFALPLAETALVHAVESDRAMLAALDAGWRVATGLKQVTHEARDLFARPLLPAELASFDAVVLDPPRAGAMAQCSELARSGLRRLAYVSCNPVSFARDCKILVAAGFAIDWVQPVDQFRWSGHVELAACLSR